MFRLRGAGARQEAHHRPLGGGHGGPRAARQQGSLAPGGHPRVRAADAGGGRWRRAVAGRCLAVVHAVGGGGHVGAHWRGGN